MPDRNEEQFIDIVPGLDAWSRFDQSGIESIGVQLVPRTPEGTA